MRAAALILVLAAALLAGCGGTDDPGTTTTAPPTTVETATAAAPAEAAAEVFLPETQAVATVVMLHGWNDLRSDAYRPWIDHLLAQDVAVVFPAYQDGILSLPASMLRGTEVGIREGLATAARGGAEGPVIAMGYSLGGGLAVVYAAMARDWGVAQPAAVYAVFPADPPGRPDPLPPVPADTSVELVVGDRDAVVGRGGADALAAAIRPHPVTVRVLTSTAAITFDHFAPKADDAAAQEAFWVPLDRLIADVAAR